MENVVIKSQVQRGHRRRAPAMSGWGGMGWRRRPRVCVHTLDAWHLPPDLPCTDSPTRPPPGDQLVPAPGASPGVLVAEVSPAHTRACAPAACVF